MLCGCPSGNWAGGDRQDWSCLPRTRKLHWPTSNVSTEHLSFSIPLVCAGFLQFSCSISAFRRVFSLVLPNGSRNKKCVTSPFKLTGRIPFFQHSRDFPQEFYFVGQQCNSLLRIHRQTFGYHNESKPKLSWEKIIVFSGIVKFFLPLHKYEHQTGTMMIEKSWSALYSYVT